MRTDNRLHRPAARPRAAAAGFTLIESLVALLVLSIGLLGVAAMQLASLQANNGAFQRTQATFLAQDIADRMRANREAAQWPRTTTSPLAIPRRRLTPATVAEARHRRVEGRASPQPCRRARPSNRPMPR